MCYVQNFQEIIRQSLIDFYAIISLYKKFEEILNKYLSFISLRDRYAHTFVKKRMKKKQDILYLQLSVRTYFVKIANYLKHSEDYRDIRLYRFYYMFLIDLLS